MPKLAIYIPKKEMREIEQWRKQINFSRVFKKALAAEIRALSQNADTPEDRLAAAASFYKEKLREDSGELDSFGHQLGVDAVLDCRLSPAEIRLLLDIEPEGQPSDEQSAAISAALSGEAKRLKKFAAQLGLGDEADWRPAVDRGFLQGVAEAWKQVCAKM